MYINLQALQTIFKILKVSLNFRVACDLVSRKVGIVRGVAKVLIKWKILVNRGI